MRLFRSFLRDELGQDLSEMGLLIALVAIASTAAYVSAGNSVGDIWTKANSQINGISSSSSTPVTSPSSGGSAGSGRDRCRDGHHDGCR